MKMVSQYRFIFYSPWLVPVGGVSDPSTTRPIWHSGHNLSLWFFPQGSSGWGGLAQCQLEVSCALGCLCICLWQPYLIISPRLKSRVKDHQSERLKCSLFTIGGWPPYPGWALGTHVSRVRQHMPLLQFSTMSSIFLHRDDALPWRPDFLALVTPIFPIFPLAVWGSVLNGQTA